MKKLLYIIIILLSISYAQTEYGVIKLKNGEVLQVEIKGVHDRVFYYELLLPFEQGNIYSFPCDEILSIHDRENNIIDLDCSKNTYDPTAVAVLKRKSEIQISLSTIGSILIAASGTIGFISINRECDDCTLEELEDFIDSQKTLGNVQYVTLAMGGIFLLIDSINNKKTINK